MTADHSAHNNSENPSKASSGAAAWRGGGIVDLNCDLGEGVGNDERIMPCISSANIACGFHAGDEETIWKTVELAVAHQVAIGAHVSFLDKANFGRTEIELPTREIYELVIQQLVLIKEIIDSFDSRLRHVKPHGALYNMAARDASVANTIAGAVMDFDPNLILFGLSGSYLIAEAKAVGLKTASEVFADRAYQDDGSLVPRSQAGAIIEEQERSVQQALQMTKEGMVTSLSGKKVPVRAETICIHGDGKHAVRFACDIKEALEKEGIRIQPPSA